MLYQNSNSMPNIAAVLADPQKIPSEAKPYSEGFDTFFGNDPDAISTPTPLEKVDEQDPNEATLAKGETIQATGQSLLKQFKER